MKKLIATALVASGLLLGSGTGEASVVERKHKASAACVTALDSADRITTISAGFAEDMSTYFTTLSDSANRHALDSDVVAFLDESTEAMTALTPKIKQRSADLMTEREIYAPASAKCRLGR